MSKSEYDKKIKTMISFLQNNQEVLFMVIKKKTSVASAFRSLEPIFKKLQSELTKSVSKLSF